jgi:endonuclease/exonuclease/phosphatase family metal-dependent hydrolase
MTFNIQHGLNGDGKYGMNWAADVIAKVNPDLVGVQELTRNHPYYNCEDQPQKLADALTSATGRHWSAVYQKEWVTQIRDCVDSGRGDDVETEGLGFFAPDQLPAPVTMPLWNSRIGLMTTLPRGNGVPVIVTHLAAQAAGQTDRLRQLDTLVPWSLTQGRQGPRVLMGDLNFSPDAPEYQKIVANYRDAWAEGITAGKARGRMDGITHKSSRIDYVFYVPGSGIELKAINNIDTRLLTGIEASDHNPLVATFTVR